MSPAEARLEIYRAFAATGQPSRPADLAGKFEITPEAAERTLIELAEARVIVLAPATRSIWMAHPFSAVPTPYQVRSNGVSYWANCAWDALAIAAVIGRDTECIAQCQDCLESIDLSVRGGRPAGDGLVHFVVPPARFWENVAFTWSTILAFRCEGHVHRWLAERRLPFGAAISLDRCWNLSRLWYYGRLEPDWRRRDLQETKAIFAEAGLSGDFWRLE